MSIILHIFILYFVYLFFLAAPATYGRNKILAAALTYITAVVTPDPSNPLYQAGD